MFQYDEKQLPKLRITPDEHKAGERDIISELTQFGQISPWRKDLVASNGQPVPVLVQPGPIAGRDDRFFALIIDAAEYSRSNKELQQLCGRLLKTYDEERRRIARELHDATAQNLAALSMNLTMLAGALTDPVRAKEILSECDSLTEECLGEIRSLSYILHPPLLDELGLESALRAFAGLYERQTGISVELELAPGHVGRLKIELEMAIFRIAQESLVNIQQHADSDRARVCLTRGTDEIELTVRDWGVGITPEAVNSEGIGLSGMRERARLLSADFKIEPANPGTLVRALFRLEQ